MKKYVTFNNILALVALIIVPLLAVPCFYGNLPQWDNQDCLINFYQRTFGGTYIPKTGSDQGAQSLIESITGNPGFEMTFNGGLFVTFLFLILGIIGLVLVNFLKKGAIFAKIGGSLFLLTSGILFCNVLQMANVGVAPMRDRFNLTGATIAFGIILIVIASLSLLSLFFKKRPNKSETELVEEK